MLYRAKTLEGSTVRCRDGALGKLNDIYFDARAWTVRYMVVSTGHLLSRRDVLISPKSITRVIAQETVIELDLSREQVRNSPPSDAEKPVSRQHELALHEYYGWEPYWGSTGALGAAAAPTAGALGTAAYHVYSEEPARTPVADTAGDPHLRSMKEVRGYGFEAIDGVIGHVEDFLLEESRWTLDYALVDTRNWLPGRHVAVPINSLKGVSWADHRVFSSLQREEVSTSPELESTDFVSMADEERLRSHYRTRVPGA